MRQRATATEEYQSGAPVHAYLEIRYTTGP